MDTMWAERFYGWHALFSFIFGRPQRWWMHVWQTACANCILTNAKTNRRHTCTKKFKQSAASRIFHQLLVTNGGWSRKQHPEQIGCVSTAVMDGAHTSPQQSMFNNQTIDTVVDCVFLVWNTQEQRFKTLTTPESNSKNIDSVLRSAPLGVMLNLSSEVL